MKVQFNSKFEEKLVRGTLKIQRLLIYRVIQRTLLLIFPFALFGSFIKIFQTVVIGKEGFLTDIFPNWGNYSSYIYFRSFLHYMIYEHTPYPFPCICMRNY